MEQANYSSTKIKIEAVDDVDNDTGQAALNIKQEFDVIDESEMKIEFEDSTLSDHSLIDHHYFDDKTQILDSILQIKLEPCSQSLDSLKEVQPVEEEVNVNNSESTQPKTVKKSKKDLAKNFTCQLCLRNFSRNINYKKHMEIHEGTREIREYKCHVCFKLFTQNSNLLRHLRTHSGEKPFICEICAKSFTEKIHLKRHLLIHKGLKSYNPKREKQHSDNLKYECEHCDKVFHCLSTKQSHVRIHNANFIPHNCLVCQKKFLNKDDLRVHLRSHTGEKPFSCDVCEKNFSRRTNLKRHRKLHFKRDEFSCGVCSKICSHESNLQRHMRIHTREDRTYTCERCSKTFNLLCSLKNHQRGHANETSLKCKLCAKVFTRNRLLTNHMRTHTGEKPFICNFCQKAFSLRSNLQRHLKLHLKHKTDDNIKNKEANDNGENNDPIGSESLSDRTDIKD